MHEKSILLARITTPLKSRHPLPANQWIMKIFAACLLIAYAHPAIAYPGPGRPGIKTLLETPGSLFAKDGPIRGKIQNEKGQPIPGATVTILKLNKTVAADEKGEFQITDLKSGKYKLRVSSVGYEDFEQDVEVDGAGGSAALVMTLSETSNQLGEVVVTAMGIKRQSRTLTYATQQLKGDQLNEVREANIANTLNGKIAGLVVTQGANGPGSATKILLRGNRSIGGDNGALIVVDGVIINNSAGSFNGAYQAPDGISSINPDDVESLNVLKGSAATALYGTTGANGVILITTKRGRVGKLTIDVNSGITAESAVLLPQVQNEYSQGNGGNFGSSSGSSWGARMAGQQVTDWTGKQLSLSPQPDNIKDFFRTSKSLNNSIGISGGTEKIQTFFSYSNNYFEGIVPENKLNRHTVTLRINTQLSKRFSTDAKISYVHQDIYDRPATAAVALNIYKIPRSVLLSDVRNYKTTDNLGIETPNYWFSSSLFGNPYWNVYATQRDERRDRVMGLVSARYQISSWLDLLGRVSLDLINDKSTSTTNNNTVNTPPGGAFSYGSATSTGTTYDLILTGKNDLTRDLKINYNLGGVLQDNQVDASSTSANGLTVPNRFNMAFARLQSSSNSKTRIQRQAGFASAQFAFRDYLYLDAAARLEYYSTLPPPYNSFYPSFGLSAILSDIIKMPEFINYAKLRVGYARTGGGGPGFLTKQTYSLSQGGYAGFISRDPVSPFPELKPELTTGKELGTELKFFNNRLGLDFTLYKSNTINQLVTVPTPQATGFSTEYLNVGDIENKGIEITLNVKPMQKPNGLTWDIDVNYAVNKNKVLYLTDRVSEVLLGNSIVDFMVSKVKVGGSFGDMYAYGLQQNAAGDFIVDTSGRPLRTEELVKVGNFNPKFTLGLNNSFEYKNFSFSFLIYGRFGGEMTSASDAVMGFDGTPDYTNAFRDANSWVLPGVRVDNSKNTTAINAETFWTTVSGGRNAWGQAFTYDATNVRIREAILGYNFRIANGSVIKGAKISLVARNLLFLYRGEAILKMPGVPKRRANFDSEVNLSTSSESQGFEYGTLPPTRSIGLNLKLSF